MEMSFGELYRYDEKFPLSAEVVEELQTDPAQVTIEQPFGSNNDWYRIHSAAIFRESEKRPHGRGWGRKASFVRSTGVARSSRPAAESRSQRPAIYDSWENWMIRSIPGYDHPLGKRIPPGSCAKTMA